jgi:hypothetical protein
MKIPVWVKPGLWGAAAGAIAMAIIGFTQLGWTTSATAEQLAQERARTAVVAGFVSPLRGDRAREIPVRDIIVLGQQHGDEGRLGDLGKREISRRCPGTPVLTRLPARSPTEKSMLVW